MKIVFHILYSISMCLDRLTSKNKDLKPFVILLQRSYIEELVLQTWAHRILAYDTWTEVVCRLPTCVSTTNSCRMKDEVHGQD